MKTNRKVAVLWRSGCLAAAVGLTMLSAGERPATADECISKEARDTLAHCPGGKFKMNITKKPQVSFSTTPEAIKKKEKVTTLKPKNPTDIAKSAQRDERRERLKPKIRKLLMTEISNVERLYKSTKKKDPDRPALMRRLAEGYVELESSAFREKIESEVEAQELKRKDPGKAKAARQNAKKAEKIIDAARRSAIKYYRNLKKQYPKWCQFPNLSDPDKSKGCTDEVLYYLAYEYEQASDFGKARDAYMELVKNWKNSRYIPNAYLAFGELFFNEAQGDPSKWPVAENFYREVIKFKPPENKLWGYARYKLGYVLWNQNKIGEAISEFEEVIKFGMEYSQLPNAPGLAVSARRDIIPVYALEGDPKQAYSRFKPLSDKPPTDPKTFKMMEELGHAYLDTGHYDDAITLYQDLMRRNKGDNYCFYQAQITQAVMASQSGQKEPIMAELKNQINNYQSFSKAKHSADSQLKCANTTASLMAETAMAWHLEAVGSGGVRGTNDPKTMTRADELYALVLQNFTSEQFAKFTFPRIVKEDWPSVAKIRYAMADLLFYQKKWEKCGPAFDAVVAEDPTGPDAAEAAFASVLCYQNIYAMKHAKDRGRSSGGHLPDSAEGSKSKKDDSALYAAKPYTEEQEGMLRAFNRYICYIKPPQGDRDALEQYVEVKYARARTYFETQHWEEAAAAFREVGVEHSDMDAGIYAAQLYLESLNVLGSKIKSPKASCLHTDMRNDVPVLIEKYCKDDKQKQENDEQCKVLFQIQRDIERLAAEAMVKEADDKGDIKLYEKAAALYLELWRKYGEDACLKDTPECKRNEEILYNAARAFQAARLIAKAIAVRRILIDPKYHLHETEPAQKAVYEIGGNYQAIAVYDLAADWYERFATNYPKMEKAPEALSDAVVLRLGLGQQEEAIKDANTFNRLFGARRDKAAQAAQIAFAIGAYYVEREDWSKADKNLSGAMSRIDTNATIDIRIQAHAMLGRTYAAQNKESKADGEYSQVIGFWDNPAKINATRKELDKLGGGDDQVLRRLAKVLTSVGEALFYNAEKFRMRAEAVKFPEYKGKGEKDDVDKFIKDKVADWMKKKEPLIDDASQQYLKIVQLQPSPPPMWVIKAGAAVGHLWGRYVAEFRSAPYPKDWDKSGESPYGADPEKGIPPLLWAEIRASYLAGLDDASKPHLIKARGAYETCLAYSVKYQYFDEDSRKCEEWLSKNFPNDFHLIDEFRGSPTRVNSGLDERPQPLRIDGTPAIQDTREQEASSGKSSKSAAVR